MSTPHFTDSAVEIPLTRGYTVIIDAADYELVSQYKWHADVQPNKRVYAAATIRNADGKKATLKMHRLIMNAPDNMDVDHKDRDGLNNQRSNLRLATRVQNNANAAGRGKWANIHSGYKGVGWNTRAAKWQAYIRVNGKQYHLGLYMTEEDAARAYDEAARRYFGEFARCNLE